MITGVSKNPVITTKTLGAQGEKIAEKFLVDAGYVVIQHNWRNRFGELDLIVQEGAENSSSTLVIVEVKTRRNIFANPADSVTPKKLAQLRKMCQLWLAQQDTYWATIRFDVISVNILGGEKFSINHLVGVM